MTQIKHVSSCCFFLLPSQVEMTPHLFSGPCKQLSDNHRTEDCQRFTFGTAIELQKGLPSPVASSREARGECSSSPLHLHRLNFSGLVLMDFFFFLKTHKNNDLNPGLTLIDEVLPKNQFQLGKVWSFPTGDFGHCKSTLCEDALSHFCRPPVNGPRSTATASVCYFWLGQYRAAPDTPLEGRVR